MASSGGGLVGAALAPPVGIDWRDRLPEAGEADTAGAAEDIPLGDSLGTTVCPTLPEPAADGVEGVEETVTAEELEAPSEHAAEASKTTTTAAARDSLPAAYDNAVDLSTPTDIPPDGRP